MSTIEELDVLFRRVLKNPEIKLTPQTTAKDVPEWDSLNHVRLFLEIEKDFNIKFSTAEILQFKSVKDLVDSIELKRAKK